MEHVLWVSLAITIFLLALAILLSLRSDPFLPRKLSSVRIRVDERPRQPAPESREHELDIQPKIGFLVLCAALFLLLMLARNG